MNLLVAAGGTGGHLFPAMAVVEQLEEKLGNDFKVTFVGSGERIESRKVPESGYEFHPMNINGFQGFSLKSLKLPFQVYSSYKLCRRLIKRNQIDAVLCAGAYISYPPGLAGFYAKKPLFLMESNVNPGKTIRMLSDKASIIFTSFEESRNFFPAFLHDRIKLRGNPVRKSIMNLPGKTEALKYFGFDDNKPVVLAVGGSLGARSINNAIENIIPYLSENNINLIWQTGRDYQAPKNLPGNVWCNTFINDMNMTFAAASLALSRSGATTVAELCVSGLPSILVPYPSASNNEQEENAKILQSEGAAVIIKDIKLEHLLKKILSELIVNKEKLSSMSIAAKGLAKPDAAGSIADDIVSFIKTNN